ncbi:hypothetical protein V2A60_009104 [Cordyceps javanica]
MSSDASRQVASPRLDPQFHHNATSPIAPGVTTPVSADTSQKPDEFPFPQASQPADKMPFAVDVPGSNSPPPPPHPPSSAAAPGSASASGSPLLLKDVIHLFHCQLCDTLFTEPVTLPCGRTICKRCIPPAHVRSRISYPAVDDRLEGFRCPFKSCAKEHTLGDCGIDVTLNKLAGHIRKAMNMRGPTAATAAAAAAPTTVVASQPTHATTTSQIHSPASTLLSQSMPADPGHHPDDADDRHTHHQSHRKHTATGNEPAKQGDHHDDDAEQASSPLARAQQLTRSELDCQVCYALYHDPLTTGCGHTFCRSCLHRILDHSRYCPICRRRLSISPLLNRASCPSNASLARIIETLWADELAARKVTIEADEAARRRDLETPLFICTLAFPQMPTFLHVFEPRYRLLVRRALEGDKTFGMVLPRRPRHAGDAAFHELGTLLRIENAQFFPDGRCLIETVGLSRFRVVRHGALDGYAVSSVERIDDISLEEEEATEAAEMAAAAAADAAPFPFPTSPDDDDKNDNDHASASATAASDHDSGDGGGGRRASRTTTSTTSSPPPPITVPSLETMTTHDLMQLATDFVRRMRDQSVPWMTDRMLAIYGECPVQDPSVFPWWLGSVLPVKDAEKYRLLGSASVRERLKICCRWIIEWETKTWYATSISSSSSGVSRVGGGDGRAA